jgi:hypothetical protein
MKFIDCLVNYTFGKFVIFFFSEPFILLYDEWFAFCNIALPHVSITYMLLRELTIASAILLCTKYKRRGPHSASHFMNLHKGSQSVGHLPRRGVFGLLGGAQVVCLRDILILNKIWAEDKIYILVCTLIG